MNSKLLLSVILVIFLIDINTALDYSDYGQQHAGEFQLGHNPMFQPEVRQPDYDQGMPATDVMGYAWTEKDKQEFKEKGKYCDYRKGQSLPSLKGFTKHGWCNKFYCISNLIKQKGGHCDLAKNMCVCHEAPTQTDEKCQISTTGSTAETSNVDPNDLAKYNFCEGFCSEKKASKYGYCNEDDKCACAN